MIEKLPSELIEIEECPILCKFDKYQHGKIDSNDI